MWQHDSLCLGAELAQRLHNIASHDGVRAVTSNKHDVASSKHELCKRCGTRIYLM